MIMTAHFPIHIEWNYRIWKVQLHRVNAPYVSQGKLELYNLVAFNNVKIGMNKMLDLSLWILIRWTSFISSTWFA